MFPRRHHVLVPGVPSDRRHLCLHQPHLVRDVELQCPAGGLGHLRQVQEDHSDKKQQGRTSSSLVGCRLLDLKIFYTSVFWYSYFIQTESQMNH